MPPYVPFFGLPLVKVQGKCIPRTFTSGLIAHHLSSYELDISDDEFDQGGRCPPL